MRSGGLAPRCSAGQVGNAKLMRITPAAVGSWVSISQAAKTDDRLGCCWAIKGRISVLSTQHLYHTDLVRDKLILVSTPFIYSIHSIDTTSTSQSTCNSSTTYRKRLRDSWHPRVRQKPVMLRRPLRPPATRLRTEQPRQSFPHK